MQLQTKYITIDEFNQYFPEINLVEAFGTKEKALAFIKRWEDRLGSFINASFNRNIDMLFPIFTDYQKEHYKLALLEQCLYIFRNSDISTDSGYDPDKGEITSRGKINALTIAPNCKRELILCGIWNRNIPDMATGILTGNWFKGY